MGQEMENPDALAGAVGVDSKSENLVSLKYRVRAELAMTLRLAIMACDPKDALETMAVAFANLSIGMPIAPLFSVMDEAGFWADFATVNELKAYALACFTRLPVEERIAFLTYVGRKQ